MRAWSPPSRPRKAGDGPKAGSRRLTGGDKIAARFMRQDFFEFTPQFKLVIAGNHKPGLRSVDEAIRRRFHLIPFTVTIPLAERDPTLKDRLKAEWPGILTWMIDGCLDWQKHGLCPPSAVVDATAAYLDAEDAIAAWLEDCCVRDPNAWATSNELFASWKAWAELAGEFVGSSKRFTQNLEARGFHPMRNAMPGDSKGWQSTVPTSQTDIGAANESGV